jgi:hypothetical protein
MQQIWIYYNILVGKYQEKRLSDRPRSRWKYIKWIFGNVIPSEGFTWFRMGVKGGHL